MSKTANQKYSICIGNSIIQSKTAQASQDGGGVTNYPGYIPVPDLPSAVGANYVLVQVYVDPTELAAANLTFDDIAGIPLVTINESDLPNIGLDAFNNLTINGNAVSGFPTPGQKLLNYGNYLIETASNIANAMIIPFNPNINVYVAFTYFQ